MTTPMLVGLSAVIVAVTDEVPRLLTVAVAGLAEAEARSGAAPDAGGEAGTRAGTPAGTGAGISGDGRGGGPDGSLDALAFGPLDPDRDRTLGLGLRRWARERTGIELGYVEQLYTFGDRDRHPDPGRRVLSVAYLALVRERPPVDSDAQWHDFYAYLPWEDWRDGRPEALDRLIVPALGRWVEAAGDQAIRSARRERADITFGLAGAPWDGDRVLERYELLYEAGLVYEAVRDQALAAGSGAADPDRAEAAAGAEAVAEAVAGRVLLGRPMALDHRRIVATALGRLRGKLKYRPVVFELLPPTFTLLQLQRLVEALAGTRLHKQNFRRLVERHRLVEGTGVLHAGTGGRPAELFRFRPEVLRERSTPGIGLPERRTGG